MESPYDYIVKPITLPEIKAALTSIVCRSDRAHAGSEPLSALMRSMRENSLEQVPSDDTDFSDLGLDHVREIVLPFINKELKSINEIISFAGNHIAELGGALAEVSRQTQPAELRKTLEDIATRTLETCSFQDIVGQRLAAIAGLVKEIETVQNDMKEALPHKPMPLSTPDKNKAGADKDHSKVKASRTSQAEIDKLFSS